MVNDLGQAGSEPPPPGEDGLVQRNSHVEDDREPAGGRSAHGWRNTVLTPTSPLLTAFYCVARRKEKDCRGSVGYDANQANQRSPKGFLNLGATVSGLVIPCWVRLFCVLCLPASPASTH